MTLLATPERLAARPAAAAGGLRPLADALAAELAPLVARPPELPREKAWLSRAGGRCPRDGAMLAFDPYSPHAHRCPRCGELHAGDLHDRWWATWRQLWIAERAVHAALLAAVRPADAAAHAALADAILEECAARYLQYPNRDNALGPTRPFFSTYLESIWTLQLAVALGLREATAPGAVAALGGRVRDRLLEPSARLVVGFDEGGSNRQVWHDAALLAAARLLGDAALAEHAVMGPSGLVRQLGDGLLADGSWYEGENYHLFAHRGLWYGVELCAAAGVELPPPLVARFDEGFATPFATALPDFTFPARRDSQHAVSLRQWRFAELAELGLARTGDARLVGALAALYDPAAPRGDDGRWRSTAEAERNEPPARLTRASLGWRSLLFAGAELTLPAPEALAAPRSALLDGQGLAVFRRDEGRLYAALDYGHSGGGHGHPDRLNLLVAHGPTRWLDDPGTGSYVEPSLHWYRSTLAHNAPLVNGRSQARVHGTLAAYDERAAAGWADAVVEAAAPGVRLRRTLVVLDDYLVSELAWEGPAGTVVDLPLHADGATAPDTGWATAPAGPDALPGPEDGWPFVVGAERALGAPFAGAVELRAVAGDARATAWMLAPPDAQLWRATAPGPPGAGARRFHFVRATAPSGRIVVVWSWRDVLASVRATDAGVELALADGTRHAHERTALGWKVALFAGAAHSSIDLAGVVEPGETAAEPALGARRPTPPAATVPRGAIALRRDGAPVRFELGEPHYRRSEESWAEAGRPRAVASVGVDGADLAVDVRVDAAPLVLRPAGENVLDNEPADVNADGVQLYLAFPDGRVAAWLAVPDAGSDAARVTRASQSTTELPLEARWAPRPHGGYAIHCRVRLDGAAGARARGFGLGLVVNETSPTRVRRRGQLVLGGGAGEFVYLRGDRQPLDRLIPFAIDDV